MGYTTEFNGSFKITPALPPKQVKYLQKFNKTRRMNRDTEKVKTLPDQERVAVDLPIGDGSGYFVGGIGFMGQNNDDSIINYNRPARGQPSLWCQWTVNDEGTELAWDEDEKFYCYVEWLDYIITHFLKIWGVELNGIIEWKGEGSEDFGRIVVDSNNVRTQTTEISLQRLTKTPAGAIRRGRKHGFIKTNDYAQGRINLCTSGCKN